METFELWRHSSYGDFTVYTRGLGNASVLDRFWDFKRFDYSAGLTEIGIYLSFENFGFFST